MEVKHPQLKSLNIFSLSLSRIGIQPAFGIILSKLMAVSDLQKHF